MSGQGRRPFAARLFACTLCAFLLTLPGTVRAQEAVPLRGAVALKYVGLSMHPHGTNHPERFKYRLDPNGRFIWQYGLIAVADRFVHRDRVALRAGAGAFSDSGGFFAGVATVGVRLRLFEIGRHRLSGGLGPTLYFREDWNEKFPDYRDDGFFSRYNGWQYLFMWYGGELEYDVHLRDRFDLSFTLVPAYPEIITLAIGVKRWY